MEVYDQQIRELKQETHKANSKTIDNIKFTATSGNYYNPRKPIAYQHPDHNSNSYYQTAYQPHASN